MDPEIVTAPEYKDQIVDALRALPTISIVTDRQSFFDLYTNPQRRGRAWERPASVEFFDPGSQQPDFNLAAGLRIQGGLGREEIMPKHSFRLFFPFMPNTFAGRISLLTLCLTANFSAFSAGSSPQGAKPNRLIDEKSPYLRQHAYNPVNWFPWSDEAFDKAKAENKLVLLSIGYSTCHWCHVMNRESFSNPEIASYLNDNYICIKVDREERPDIDQVYMTFAQRANGSGGWPLNVWLTPDRKPFYAGTYFPPSRRPGYSFPAFPDILERIDKLWQEKPDELIAQSEKVVAILNESLSSNSESTELTIDANTLPTAVRDFDAAFDDRYGGFGPAPKFPSTAGLSFLISVAANPSAAEDSRNLAKDMALVTLDAIARGGINDHLAGGFHRYSVDSGWKIPHFEKMLYDQGLLASVFAEAWILTRKDKYRFVTERTLDYLLGQMRHEEGGFYSAEDAESIDPDKPEEKREGAFYVWSWEQLEAALGEPDLLEQAAEAFQLQKIGNVPPGLQGADEVIGYNTLRRAKKHTAPEETIQLILNKLATAQKERIRPALDNKIIVGWNGMAISAFAKAGLLWNSDRYRNAAINAATFIKTRLYDSDTATLKRLYLDGPSMANAYADDYAYLIRGLIDLYEATADVQWLDWAKALQETQIDQFYDVENGGFFSFAPSDDIVFKPMKEIFDGAIPSVSSISAENLARLAQVFDHEDYANKAKQTITAFEYSIRHSGRQLPYLLKASSFVAQKPIQIVLAGDPKSEAFRQMLELAAQTPLAQRLLLYADGSDGQNYLG